MELLTATVSVPVWTLLLFGGICIADMVIRDRHTRMAIDTANKAVRTLAACCSKQHRKDT